MAMDPLGALLHLPLLRVAASEPGWMLTCSAVRWATLHS